MKTIHIYLGNEKVYSVYANSFEEVRLNPEAFYKDYEDNMIISEIEYTNPIFENGTLREATKDELVAKGIEVILEEGEVIRRKKIVKIEKPSQYHTWNGANWTIDLDELKKIKREELKKIRTAKVEENIEVHNEIFQVRNTDKENFDDVGLMIRTGEIDYSYIKNWVLADNSIKPFTAQQIIDVWKERTKRKDRIYLEFGQLSLKLETCNSVEEIESIKWE